MSEVIKEVAVPEETVGPVPAAGAKRFSGQVYRAERRATGALADVPDQIPDLHSLFGHEQDDGALAIEGPWLQRPGRGSAGRLGLGTGHDRVHPACRLID